MKASTYLDTSIILRHILGEPGVYPKLNAFEKHFSSELMVIEARRAIDRLRILKNWQSEEIALRVQLLTEFEEAISMIPLQATILRRAAEPFPTVVGTLDALHIASALLAQVHVQSSLSFLTHDKRQGLAAQASGLKAEGWE